jgi:glutathione S-transferase
MKLFYLPYACSLAPQILLNEIGVPYELEKMNKADKTSILKYNPKGSVPTLVLDNEQPLTETAVILQYISDLKPELNLVPKTGTWERYKCQEWLNYVSSELHKGIGILFNPEFDDNAKNVLRAGAKKKLTWLNEHFASNQFLMGNQFTAPDAYAFTTISWTKSVGIDISDLPNLLAFLERVKARPAVVAALTKQN